MIILFESLVIRKTKMKKTDLMCVSVATKRRLLEMKEKSWESHDNKLKDGSLSKDTEQMYSNGKQ